MCEILNKALTFIRKNLRDMQGMAIPTPGGVSVFMVDKPTEEKKVEKLPDTDPRNAIRKKWHDDFSEG